MISVLYVDDEQVLLDLAKRFLEADPEMRVDTSDSVRLALETIQDVPYDAIVSDFQMPEMDGITFLKKVRSSHPQLPFIIFTGRSREEVVIEALNNGADQYLQKGGNPTAQFAELNHMIRQAVERRRARDTILHLSRLNAVLSSTNRAVIRIRNRHALLCEACRIAVEDGAFLMAWIGIIDPLTLTVSPVAACGYEEGYLANLSISLDNIPGTMGLSGTAIERCSPVISNDIETDPKMAHYRERAAARGYRSSAALPIMNGGHAIGVMRFYSREKNFFNPQEVRLLEDLVADIGFALGIMAFWEY